MSPKKTLGQHWLRDDATLRAMCEAGDVNAKDTVLEIGPGLGTLTKHLTKRAGHVIAIEVDPILANTLHDKAEDKSKLTVIHADILRFDLTELPVNYKVVANIPYYLTGHLLRLLSETTNPPTDVALLVQKEVAERVTSTPGAMSNLSVATQFYWEASTGMTVPAKLFTPPPKVDSRILILKRRTRALFPDVEHKAFFRLVKAGLSALNFLLVVTNFPETLENVQKGLKLEWNKSVHNIMRAATTPGLRSVFPTIFLFWAGFTFFTTFFGVYVTDKLGFKANNLGDFFAYIGIWVAFTQAVITNRLAKRFANWQIVQVSTIGLSLALLLNFIPRNTTQLLLLTPPIMIFVGLMIANSTALVSRTVGPEMQGEVLGIMASVQALAQAIPAALTGFLGGINRNVPIIAASVTIAYGGLLFLFLYRPSRRVDSPDPQEATAIAH